jgi:threonine/homoserine efflux transporter RhtA
MRTDKALLIKGLKYLGITIALMFTAPVVLSQAFKNQDHPFFWPVLIVGGLLALSAIAGGFYSINVIMGALFGKRK